MITPVLFLLLVATPMSVRPRPITPGMRFICSTIISPLPSSWYAAQLVDLKDVVALVAGVDERA